MRKRKHFSKRWHRKDEDGDLKVSCHALDVYRTVRKNKSIMDLLVELHPYIAEAIRIYKIKVGKHPFDCVSHVEKVKLKGISRPFYVYVFHRHFSDRGIKVNISVQDSWNTFNLREIEDRIIESYLRS